MQKLITVRHGHHQWGELSEEGKKQIADLVPRLKLILGDYNKSTVAVLSSTSLRTKQSGEIIAGEFGVTNQPLGVFLYDNYDMFGNVQLRDWIVEGVKSHEANIVIIVTHFEAPAAILNIFSQARFGKKVGCFQTANGFANLLNLETGEVILGI